MNHTPIQLPATTLDVAPGDVVYFRDVDASACFPAYVIVTDHTQNYSFVTFWGFHETDRNPSFQFREMSQRAFHRHEDTNG